MHHDAVLPGYLQARVLLAERLHQTASIRAAASADSGFNRLNLCQVEHACHRSHGNLMVNLMAGIIAYSLAPNKPHLPLISSGPPCG